MSATTEKQIYGASPIKRKRSTNTELQKLLDAILSIVNAEQDAITIRHLFYRLVSVGEIEKTERAYQNLCRNLSKWRKSGQVGFHHFIDATRYYSGIPAYGFAGEALRNTVESYRRNLWQGQQWHLEIWTEKDAIRSILQPTANRYCLETFACRGFPSLSSLHQFAETVNLKLQQGKYTAVLYFGDYDEAGLRIGESIVKTVEEQFNVSFKFMRVAVNESQLLKYDLPTRPAKGKSRMERCVEVDALSSSQIRSILNAEIQTFIDVREWESQEMIEEEERETMRHFMKTWTGGAR